MWHHTDGGPSHDCWLTGAFQHRLHWCLTSDPPWVICHQLFHRRSRCRQEWLLRDWGVLLLDVIMNTAVVIYSRHLNVPSIYLNASMFTQIIRDTASATEEVSSRFFNESLQTPFLIMCYLASFRMNAAKVNSQRALEERGGVSRAH